MELLNNIDQALTTFLENAGIWAPLFSSILVVLEGTFAFLPLFVFITVNILTMGTILGASVSWICTTIGSFIAFWLCRKGLSPLFKRFIKNKNGLSKFMNMISKMKFSKLVLIISIPLTPSFFVNLAAGLSDIAPKKYFYALLIAKTCIILFWGVVGTSLVECLTNPIALIKVVLMVFACNLFSKIINKLFKIDNMFDDKATEEVIEK